MGPSTTNVATTQSEGSNNSNNETIHLHIAITPIYTITIVNNHVLPHLI